jgi:hypothetical protein
VKRPANLHDYRVVSLEFKSLLVLEEARLPFQACAALLRAGSRARGEISEDPSCPPTGKEWVGKLQEIQSPFPWWRRHRPSPCTFSCELPANLFTELYLVRALDYHDEVQCGYFEGQGRI